MLIERDPSLRTVVLETDVVVTNLAECKCFALNGSASMVWNLLDTPNTVDQICTALIARYDVSEDQCRADVETLVDEWRNLGLVRPVG